MQICEKSHFFSLLKHVFVTVVCVLYLLWFSTLGKLLLYQLTQVPLSKKRPKTYKLPISSNYHILLWVFLLSLCLLPHTP